MAKSISLEDLIALNDEIAGLVRAGVPLNIGLAGWGRDLPGDLGNIATRLSEATAQGQTLSESFAAQGDRIPRVYTALVTAGLRSGRLPAALESLTTTARSLTAARRFIGLAALYPLLVALVAYGLFILVASTALSATIKFYEGPPPRLWSTIAEIGQPASLWMGLLPPLVLVVAAALWWRRTRRAIIVDTPAAVRWLRIVPAASRAMEQSRSAALAEVLGLLVEHQVPLDEAILLAAGCTADRSLMRTADKAAEYLRRGGTFAASVEPLKGFPPLVAWMISAGGREQSFAALARQAAGMYRRNVQRDLDWLRLYLPVWLIVLVGGIVAGIYGAAFFVPYSQFLDALAGPTFFLDAQASAMTVFHYIAMDEQGREVNGTIEALDWQAATESLAARGLREPRAVEAPAEATPERLAPSEATELARYVTELAKSGLPLDGGLRAIAKDLPAGRLSRALDRLASRLEAGQPLSAAIESIGTRMPSHLRELMTAGARSGNLPQTFDKMLDQESQVDDLGRQFRQAIAYPLIILAFLAIWILFVTLYLVPQLNSFQPSWPEHTSRMTRYVAALSRIMPGIIATLAMVLVLLFFAGRMKLTAAFVSRTWTRLPWIGPAWWYRGLVEFCGLMDIFLQQGKPLPDALRLTSLAARDAGIRGACAGMAEETAGGQALSTCLARRSLFPATLVNTVAWGESHAALAESCGSSRRMFFERFQSQIELIRLVLPPIVFLVLAISVIFFAAGLLGGFIAMVNNLCM